MEIVTLAGPLERSRLRWVAGLYGRVDPRYRDEAVLEHLLTRSPAGAALHAFALDGERPVGHCAVIPMHARHGSDPLRAGKLEALYVEEQYRGQHLARHLLDRLYAFSDEQGIELLHAFATERIGGVIRFRPLARVGRRALVAVIGPRTAAERAIARAQGALRKPVRADATLRPVAPEDADLVMAQSPPRGRWTVLAEDAWDWYCSSPLLRVLEVRGSRALVQVPGSPGRELRLVGWRGERALQLVAGAARAALELGAGTVRFQPWGSPGGGGALTRACRLLGFVPRTDLSTLWVRAHDPALARAEAVVPTPILYLGF